MCIFRGKEKAKAKVGNKKNEGRKGTGYNAEQVLTLWWGLKPTYLRLQTACVLSFNTEGEEKGF